MKTAKRRDKHGVIIFIVVILLVALCSVGIFFNGFVKRVASTAYSRFMDFARHDDPVLRRVAADDLLLETYASPVEKTGDIRALELSVSEPDFHEDKAVSYEEYILPELNVQLQYAVTNGFTHILYKTSLYSEKDYDVLEYIREQTRGMGLKLIVETDLLLLNEANDESAFAVSRYTPVYETVRGGFWERLLYPTSSAKKYAVSGVDPSWIYISNRGARRLNPAYEQARDFAVRELEAALSKYEPDLFLLDVPAYKARDVSETDNLSRTGCSTVAELHRRSTSLMTVDVSKMIDETFPDTLFGVRANRVWRSKSVDETGVEISSAYSDYDVGCADTLDWCERGYLDFVAVYNNDSMAANDNFLTAMNWWKDVEARTGVRLICGYTADMINTTPEWSGYYELANEYDAAVKEGCYSGIFSDYNSLFLHADEAELLYMVFSNTIDFGIADEELNLTSPANGITVDVPEIAVSGTCDNNFEIKINGKTVEPTKRGFFATDIKLSPGRNVITVEHKGKTITRKVNYNLVIMKDITPTDKLSVMGGSKVEYTVTARSGARVKGTLNGETVSFTEYPLAGECTSPEGVFALFTGEFTVPKSKSEAYSIGSAKVTASFKGFVKTLEGAKVNIIPALPSAGNVAVVKVDKAETFRAEPANSDRSMPQYFWLPKGTRDYIVSESAYTDGNNHKEYLLLKCGLRVYKSEVTVEKTSLSVNKTVEATLSDSGKYTYLTFKNSERVPYKLVMNGLYPAGDTNATQATSDGFGRLDVILCNTEGETSVTGGSTALMRYSSVSSNAEAHTVTYSFTLAKNGDFCGFVSYYDNNGNLVIRFRNPIKAKDGRLDGVRICLDPGHGGVDSGAPGFNGAYEANENLKVAKVVREKLEALGATVFMTREDNRNYSDGTPITSSTLRPNRLALIDGFKPDLLISIHHNSFQTSSAHGTEALYFYGFNQKLAQTVANNMSAVSGMRNRGGKYQNVFVYRNHDFMSILLECGFLSNVGDSEWLATPGNTDKLAGGIVKGIVEYFS